MKLLCYPGLFKFLLSLSLHSYTPEQVYNVVANINDYCKFLPWCTQSAVVKEGTGSCVARLVVGFPPLVESYTSLITLRPHRLVRVSVRLNGEEQREGGIREGSVNRKRRETIAT